MTIFFRNQIRPVKNYDRLGWCMTILRAGHYSKNLQGCKFCGREPFIIHRWTKVRVGQKKIPYSRKGLSVFKEKGVTPLLVRTFDLLLRFQGCCQGRVLSV